MSENKSAMELLIALADDFGKAADEYHRNSAAAGNAGRILDAEINCAMETVAGSCERALRAAIDKIVYIGEHFPDLTYEARMNEAIEAFRDASRLRSEIQQARISAEDKLAEAKSLLAESLEYMAAKREAEYGDRREQHELTPLIDGIRSFLSEER